MQLQIPCSPWRERFLLWFSGNVCRWMPVSLFLKGCIRNSCHKLPWHTCGHGHYDGRSAAAHSQKILFSVIIEPVKTPGGSGTALEYTEEKLNGLDKETIIQLFLSQQEQLKQIGHNLQLVLEQMSDLKRHRFGRSSERHEPKTRFLLWKWMGKSYFLTSGGCCQ